MIVYQPAGTSIFAMLSARPPFLMVKAKPGVFFPGIKAHCLVKRAAAEKENVYRANRCAGEPRLGGLPGSGEIGDKSTPRKPIPEIVSRILASRCSLSVKDLRQHSSRQGNKLRCKFPINHGYSLSELRWPVPWLVSLSSNTLPQDRSSSSFFRFIRQTSTSNILHGSRIIIWSLSPEGDKLDDQINRCCPPSPP